MKIFNKFFSTTAFILLFLNVHGQVDTSMKVRYTFNKLTPDSNHIIDDMGDTAILQSKATVRPMTHFNVLDLGSTSGYLDLGSNIGKLIATLDNFTISTYVFVSSTVDLNSNGNFIWTFANSNDVATTPNGQMFFSAKSLRYAISQTNWTGESSLNYAKELTKGAWKHVTYTQLGSTGTIYVDAIAVSTGTVTKTPKALGATKYNYIGRSPYVGDAFLSNSLIYDFRIYNRSLSSIEISALDDSLAALNDASTTDLLVKAGEALSLGSLNEVILNLRLPTQAANNIVIQWTSSNPSAISNSGLVTRPAIGSDTAKVVLTATLTKDGKSITKDLLAVVLPLFDDKICIKRDSAAINIPGNLDNLRSDMKLPQNGLEGSVITWKSDKSDYLSNNGKVLKFAPKGTGKVKVTLTATITKGSQSTQRNFVVYIAEDEGYVAYLFVYFTGNDITQEQIRFALSNDGLNYRALNGNNPILQSSAISLTGGVRDPHIYRGPDGKYYMVVTDMVSANGWASNRGIVLLKSSDLIDWTSSTVNIPTAFPDSFANITAAWAPQTIYDETVGKMMVYFSIQKTGGIHIIYYAYANADFTALETTPKQLFYSPTNSSCIDADILYKDGIYNLFFKTEGSGNGIKKATSTKLTEGYVLYDQYLDQSYSAVEGAGTFKLINSDKYILMYDVYTSGLYEFTESTDLVNFKVVNELTSTNFTPRHGTVIPITKAEAEALSKKWSKPTDVAILSSRSSHVKWRNIVIDNAKNTVFVPVKNGTDLSNFDPQFTSMPGAVITPTTAQDFTKDSLSYTVSIDGIGSKTYKVTAETDNNPILDGYYADPEVLYSKKTGKYYIYPTSDGYTGWSGNYFKTFSSSNLVDWQDEGVILNLPTDVSWATTNAWAPTIIEKQINGVYKYFFYFCAAQKIGVAIADNPTGPFFDSGQPLISATPAGASGQQIDPDVFYDSISGKTYLYWGNGYLARAELNDDMVSIKPNTTKVIATDATFREGCEVFYRNGKYYFMWSENDTRSEDYRVRYATASSPTGILNIPGNNLVIAKNSAQGIYATGHNCVLYVPDSSKWYIIYHRFTRPKGITMGDPAGYNREVCMDELKFNDDGSIIQVIPTLKGIILDTAKQDTTVGIKIRQKQHSAFTVFPNPAHEILNVSFTDPNNLGGMILIYDSAGRKQLQKLIENDQSQINISKLCGGVYFIKYVKGDQELGSGSFVK